ncbi:MAG: zf-HC2 domain-containing protein, partial [Corynebacterium variabile]
MTDKQTNHPSGCDDLVDVLYEYVDGGCDENLRGRLAEHAENCPS